MQSYTNTAWSWHADVAEVVMLASKRVIWSWVVAEVCLQPQHAAKMLRSDDGV